MNGADTGACIVQYGTQAERLALATSNIKQLSEWYETDTGIRWKWFGLWVVFADTVANLAVEPGQDSQFDRTWGGSKWAYSQKTTSGTVKSTAAVYGGCTVVVATATGAINIRNGTSTGEIIDVIPAATAVGSKSATAIAAPLGLYIEFVGGATGTVNVLYI